MEVIGGHSFNCLPTRQNEVGCADGEKIAEGGEVVWRVVREEIEENCINAGLPHIPPCAFCVKLKNIADEPQGKTGRRKHCQSRFREIVGRQIDCVHFVPDRH